MKNIIYRATRIVLVIAVLLFINGGCNKSTSLAKAPAIQWMSIQQATQLSQQNHKKIYLFIYTDWCTWCHKFDSITLSNPEIIKNISDNFIAVKLNAETTDPITMNGITYNKPAVKGIWVTNPYIDSLLNHKLNYPASVFIDASGNRLGDVQYGSMPVSEFKLVLNYMSSDSYKSVSPEAYSRANK